MILENEKRNTNYNFNNGKTNRRRKLKGGEGNNSAGSEERVGLNGWDRAEDIETLR